MERTRFNKIVEAAKLRRFNVASESILLEAIPFVDETIYFSCCICGEMIAHSMPDRNLLNWIQKLTCHNTECNDNEQADIAELTETGEMLWCEDIFQIAEKTLDKEETYRTVEGTWLQKVYKAYLPNIKEAYFSYHEGVFRFFAQCLNNKKKQGFVLFELENPEDNVASMSLVLPQVGKAWLNRIKQQFSEKQDAFHFQMIHDRYINYRNSVAERTKENKMAIATCFEMIALMRHHVGKYTDENLRNYLSMHRCPICGRYYTSVESTCGNCGFSGINVEFINRDEAKCWQSDVLQTYQLSYWKQEMEIDRDVLRKVNKEIGVILSPFVCVPYGVEVIDASAFSFCNACSVRLPSSVRQIRRHAFFNSEFYFIHLPDGLLEISAFGFFNCKKLVSVLIPASVAHMGVMAFFGSRFLDIYCEAEEKPSDWEEGWNLLSIDNAVYAKVHWGGTWHYENGIPIQDSVLLNSVIRDTMREENQHE